MTNRKRELSGSGPERLLGLAWGLGDLGRREGGEGEKGGRVGGREGVVVRLKVYGVRGSVDCSRIGEGCVHKREYGQR